MYLTYLNEDANEPPHYIVVGPFNSEEERTAFNNGVVFANDSALVHVGDGKSLTEALEAAKDDWGQTGDTWQDNLYELRHPDA